MTARLCAIACGVAVTWACAAFGHFLLTARGCTLRSKVKTAIRQDGIFGTADDVKNER